MTTKNQEAAYKKHRRDEKNYEAREGLNSGITSTETVRAHSKEIADNLLSTYPELAELDKPEPEEKEEEKKETKSRGKK